MKLVYSFKDYRKLFKLARSRKNSVQDYIKFEKFQCDLLVRYFLSQGILLNDKLLLDLGCGPGGYTQQFKFYGALPVGLDLDVTYLSPALMKVSADALHIPFNDNQFDMVFCASLIEHIPNPEHLIAEIVRVTKQGGFIYISYPPFFSPGGGHQFSPYHLIGERFALWIYINRSHQINNEWHRQRISLHPESYKNAFRSWGLFPISIKKVKGIVKKYSLDIIDCSTKYLQINFANIPLINEFTTWHVQFLMFKL